MFFIKSLTRISPSASSVVTGFRNPGSLTTFSYRFCTSTQIQPTAATLNGVDRARYYGLGPTKEGEKPRVVVLGSGWAGCRFMKGIDTNLYDVVCVSPRNHMVLTPLLASTCVGTLEFRSVAEPISRIQPAISREPGSYFFLANCSRLDADSHEEPRKCILNCENMKIEERKCDELVSRNGKDACLMEEKTSSLKDVF